MRLYVFGMYHDLLEEIEAFQRDSGLSDDRVGKVLHNNGRLLERLRAGRRVWPEAVAQIRLNIASERAARGLGTTEKGAA